MPAMVQTARARPRIIVSKARRPRWRAWAKVIVVALAALAVLYHGWILFCISRLKGTNPSTTALMEQRSAEARERGEEVKRIQTWAPYDRISRNLVRAVLAGEDSRFFDHSGFDWEEINKALEEDWKEGRFRRGASTITQQLAKNLFLSTSKKPAAQASRGVNHKRDGVDSWQAPDTRNLFERHRVGRWSLRSRSGLAKL